MDIREASAYPILTRLMDTEKITLRRHSITCVDTVEVFTHELDGIERESLDVGQDLQYASITASIAATILVAILLTEIRSPTRYAAFFAAFVAFGVLALYFFSNYYRKRTNFRSTIQTIRARQVGPVGEQGREMRPAEVAQLPAEPRVVTGAFTADAALVKQGDATVEGSATPPRAAATPEISIPESGTQK